MKGEYVRGDAKLKREDVFALQQRGETAAASTSKGSVLSPCRPPARERTHPPLRNCLRRRPCRQRTACADGPAASELPAPTALPPAQRGGLGFRLGSGGRAEASAAAGASPHSAAAGLLDAADFEASRPWGRAGTLGSRGGGCCRRSCVRCVCGGSAGRLASQWHPPPLFPLFSVRDF